MSGWLTREIAIVEIITAEGVAIALLQSRFICRNRH